MLLIASYCNAVHCDSALKGVPIVSVELSGYYKTCSVGSKFKVWCFKVRFLRNNRRQVLTFICDNTVQ